MTRRSAQPLATIPTGPLQTIEEKREQQKPKIDENPLTAFFRKSKLSLTLPSHGKWYTNTSITYDSTGQLPVFAMTASDDIKLRTGDATLSGKNIYDVIQSCIPNISQPEIIPSIDIDAILLAIRIASYGAEFDFSVSVPNTTLTKTITLNATDLLKEISTRTDVWDEEITIEDETGQSLYLEIHPISLENLFATSKNIFMLRRSLAKNFDQDENIKDETLFSSSINTLTTSAIDLLCSSVKKLQITNNNGQIALLLDAANPQDEKQIKQTIHQLDIAYFNSIRDHIDNQRKKYMFTTTTQESTQKEIEAGAPTSWVAELSFMGSDFLPESKSLTSSF